MDLQRHPRKLVIAGARPAVRLGPAAGEREGMLVPELAQHQFAEDRRRPLAAYEAALLHRGVDEAAARRSLRDQIAHLERELSALFTAAQPRRGLEWQIPAPGGPRILGVGELESLRDHLASRVEDTRRTLRERGTVETRNRDRIDRMIAEPNRFKWVRISNEDIGEPGCKHWHSRPRLGLVGMLMGWWRVKISSGCP